MTKITSKNTITLFGGSGFIGTELVKVLALTGARIRVATRYPQSVEALKPFGVVGQISPIIVNIHQPDSINAATQGSDYVVNLVGLLSETKHCSFELAHHIFPEEIARACWRHKIKHFVHISALGADPASESAYAKTKAMGEKSVMKKAPSWSILRPSLVFGPGDNFFNKFAKMSQISPVLPLIGGGHTQFQPIYVGDLVKAIMTCLTHPKQTNEIYELGGPEIYSFKSLMEKMLGKMHQKKCFMTLSWSLAGMMAKIFKHLPNPQLTPDQLILLRQNNVVSNNMHSLHDLGISATHLDVILPQYLERFQSGGIFSRSA